MGSTAYALNKKRLELVSGSSKENVPKPEYLQSPHGSL